jgi:hypothetical protein
MSEQNNVTQEIIDTAKEALQDALDSALAVAEGARVEAAAFLDEMAPTVAGLAVRMAQGDTMAPTVLRAVEVQAVQIAANTGIELTIEGQRALSTGIRVAIGLLAKLARGALA